MLAALILFSCGKSANPFASDKAVYLYNQALASYMKGDLESSEKGFQEILLQFPDHTPSCLVLGKICYFRSDIDRSEKYFQKALSTGPNVPGLIGLSRIALVRKDPKKGLQFLNEALMLDPSNPQTHLELGKFYRAAGEEEKALYHYQFALSFIETFGQAKLELASLYSEIGLNDKAREIYSGIIASPDMPLSVKKQAQNSIDSPTEPAVSRTEGPAIKK